MKTFFIKYSYEYKNSGHWTETHVYVPENMVEKKVKKLKEMGCKILKVAEARIM